MDHASMAGKVGEIASNVERAVSGECAGIFLTVEAMLAGGHVLIKDAPGVGKTPQGR